MIKRTILVPVLVAALLGIANASTITIQNASFGSATVADGVPVTWAYHTVGAVRVAFRTEGGVASQDFAPPAGVTIRAGLAFASSDGKTGWYNATCPGGVRCAVSFDSIGTATVTSIPNTNFDIAAVLNDGTWLGNIPGVGAVSGSVGTSNFTSIANSAAFSLANAVQVGGKLISVGAETSGGNAFAGILEDKIFSTFDSTSNFSTAYAFSPDGKRSGGGDAGFATLLYSDSLSEQYLPVLNSLEFQKGTTYSVTNGGAASGINDQGRGWVYSPKLGGTMNPCATIVMAGNALPTGQSVGNCTIGFTTIVEYFLLNELKYALFGNNGGSVFISDGLNADIFTLNRGSSTDALTTPEPFTGGLALWGLACIVMAGLTRRRLALSHR